LHTGADLKKLTEKELTKYFGKAGRFYYYIVRGIDNRRVEPDRETKSVGAEDTFAFDLTALDEMNSELERIAETVYDRLKRHKMSGRTVTLKIKYSDFKQITRNRSFLHPIDDLETITDTAKQLLALTETEGKAIRLLGITLSNFGEVQPVIRKVEDTGQLRLF
jgi:DNA polymerase-4